MEKELFDSSKLNAEADKILEFKVENFLRMPEGVATTPASVSKYTSD